MSQKAESVSPPQEVFKRPTAAACEHLLIPTKMHDSYVTVKAVTTGVWIRFTHGVAGTEPADIVIATNSSVASNELTSDVASGFYIEPGSSHDFDLAEMMRLRSSSEGASSGGARIYLSHISADALGYVILYKSSGPKGA